MNSETLAITNGKVVLEDRVIANGTVLIKDGFIVAAADTETIEGTTALSDCRVLDAKGNYVGPGFVDLHCHAGGDFWMRDDPAAAAKHHLAGGTTSLNVSLSYSEELQQILSGMQKARAAINSGESGNITGIFLEGPFLNPKYGANSKSIRPYNRQEYDALMKEGGDLIRMWTIAVEMPNSRELLKNVVSSGIVAALGHTEASVEDINWAVNNGATVCTHLTNATGITPSPARFGGTREIGVDEAVMLRDEVCCEIICDEAGAHVRHDMVRFIIKAVGIDRVVGVTDCCTGPDDASDINIVNGELSGSKLKMNMAARNFYKHVGLSMVDVFKVCSRNGARAIRQHDVGTIEAGKRANLVIVNDNFDIEAVLLNGKAVINNL